TAKLINTPIRRIRSACCARAASGQVAAEPTITLRKSRRRIAFPKAQDHANPSMITAGICDRRNGVQGVKLHGINPEPFMSALGQKQTFECIRAQPADIDVGNGARRRGAGRMPRELKEAREQQVATDRVEYLDLGCPIPGGRTSSRYDCGCLAKSVQHGMETTRVSMPCASSSFFVSSASETSDPVAIKTRSGDPFASAIT